MENKNKMINIKSGKIFYKLVVENNKNTKSNLLSFLSKKGFSETQLNKLRDIDFLTENKSIRLKKIKMDLTLNLMVEEITLLFGTDLDSTEFSAFIEGFFE